MPLPSSLSLVLPPELESAVARLSDAYFLQNVGAGTVLEGLGGSVGNVLSNLVHKGLQAYVPILDAAIEEHESDLAAYSEIVSYLDRQPDRTAVRSADFPDGSAAQHVLREIEAANWAALANADDGLPMAWALTHTEAVRELNWRRTRLDALKEAQFEILEAIRSKSWLRVSHRGGEPTDNRAKGAGQS